MMIYRMGSFTSAPKMVNDDNQDDDVDFETVRSEEEMKERCRMELTGLPECIQRPWPITSRKSSDPKSIRLFQWNILSQCKFCKIKFLIKY